MTTKHPPFKQSASKGLTAMILVLFIAILVEFVIVQVFLAFGLTDKNPLSINFQIFGQAFTLAVSPLFHLIPLSVTIVLVSSWTFLAKHGFFKPQRIKTVKKPFKKEKKPMFKSLRGFYKNISRALEKFYHKISSAILRVPGISYIKEKLALARTAVQSITLILFVFVAIATMLCFLAYPRLLYNLVRGFYDGNKTFLGFVTATTDFAKAVGQVLSPIDWLGASINNGLLATAPGFRNAFSGLGTVTVSLVELDVVGKYVVVQNVAAWISAFTALIYARYTPRIVRH